MTASTTFELSQIIDSRRMGSVHWLIVALSFTLMLLDGYDLICIAFVAPLLQKEWGFDRSAFGLLFGAATLGTVIGPMIFGPLSDKWGRKPVLLLGTIWFGLFTLACVMTTALQQMLILRLFAGIGLGGVIATAIAYVTEFAPKKIRATMVVMGVVGLALGGGLGALVAARMLGIYTWRAIFWIGGLAPLTLAMVAVPTIPESPHYLALDPARHPALLKVLRRLAPDLFLPSDAMFIVTDQGDDKRFSYAAIFTGHLRAIVPLLMLTMFLAQFALFFVNQWTTILLTSNGVPVQRAAYATAAFQIFGFLGALGITRPVDRFGFLPVPILFMLAAGVIATMGLSGLSESAIIALAGAAGFCVIGLQFGNIAATGQVFPTPVRSGGVGLCYGVGRIGSVAGPSIAGLLVGLQVPLHHLFVCAGALMLVGVAAGLLLTPLYRRQLDDLQLPAQKNLLAGIPEPIH